MNETDREIDRLRLEIAELVAENTRLQIELDAPIATWTVSECYDGEWIIVAEGLSHQQLRAYPRGRAFRATPVRRRF